MKILLGDFIAEVGRDNIFKPTIWNESLLQDSNGNGVRIVNFATSKKKLVFKSMMFLHRDIHKYAWNSPDGKTHNQIDHILIDRRWKSSIVEVSGKLTVIVITLVVANVRDRLAVSKQSAQKFDGERFNLRKLNEQEVKKQYQIEITNSFATLEN